MSFRDAIAPMLDRCFRTGGILGYHAVLDAADVPSSAMHISVATMRRQLEFVRARYTVLALRELVDRHRTGRSTDRCLAITFDDAYAGIASLAAPLLRELDLPATIFVTTDVTERSGTYWWDALEQARRDPDGECWAALLRLLHLPLLPPTIESLALMRDRIISRHGGRFDLSFEVATDERLHAMDVGALQALALDSRFDFGCHTMSHPALPCLSVDEQEREMRDALGRLNEVLPRVIPIVAYPFGLYDETTMDAARRAALVAGVTMQPRALARSDSPLALPRVGVSEDWTDTAIALRVNSALRPLFIARMGGLHPQTPADPLLAAG